MLLDKEIKAATEKAAVLDRDLRRKEEDLIRERRNAERIDDVCHCVYYTNVRICVLSVPRQISLRRR